MKIIGIEHIGIAVKDLSKDAPFWSKVLGIERITTEDVDDQGVITDIYNTGIYLAGGEALLRGLDERLSKKTDLPVYIAEDPLQAVVRGTGIALKNIDKFKSVLIK